MLHLGSRIALGMYIANLLELQRALQSHGVRVATTQIEEVAGIGKLACHLLYLLVALEHFAYLVGYLAQRVHRFEIVLAADGALGLAQSEGKHGEHRDLTCEGFGRRHANLRTHVYVRARVGGTWYA